MKSRGLYGVVFFLLLSFGCRPSAAYVEVPESDLEPYDDLLSGHVFITPQGGFVPNAETAVRIAEAVLEAAYEEEVLLNQRPLRVVLRSDGVWVIVGTLPHDYVGGVAHVEISRLDGRVLRVSHGS
jgi:NTF2 fold immunity protein of polymorphic toxin system component